MEALEFDPTRWAVYLLVGPIGLAAYFLFGSRKLKLMVLLGALIFLEGVLLSWRPFYFVGFSLSSAIAYALFVSLYLDPRQRLQIPASTVEWLGFLFFAFVGAVIGGFVPLAGFGQNFILFQMFYLEGLVYFWIGRAAFRDTNELYRVLNVLFAMGGLVAILHLFSITTGYRFYAAAGKEFHEYSDVAFRYGAVFSNPNTLADFYAMVLPASIISTLGWARPSRLMRSTILVSIALMGVSLLLTASRAGIGTTVLMVMISFMLLPFGVRGALALAATGVVTGSLSVALLFFFFPDLLDATLGRFATEGFTSVRYQVWLETLLIIVRNPLGVGLDSQGYLQALQPAGIFLANPHNIYLGIAVNAGLPGLGFFLAIVTNALRRANVSRRIQDAEGRSVASMIFVMLVAFLISGMAEPIYGNGIKLQHFFWLVVGIATYLPNLVSSDARDSPSASILATRGSSTNGLGGVPSWGDSSPQEGSPL